MNFNKLKNLTLSQASLVILGIVIAFLGLWFIALRIGKPVMRSVCVAALSSDSKVGIVDQRPRTVEAQTVKLDVMSKRLNTVGYLRANAIVMIKSEMSGKVAEILFTVFPEIL